MNIHVAPMMGYTDYYFRKFIQSIFPNVITYTEMLVDQALLHNSENLLNSNFDAEDNSILQIASSNPSILEKTLKKLISQNFQNEINLNLGCPSKRVQKNSYGLALTEDYAKTKDVLVSLKDNYENVSIKCRIGLGSEQSKDYIYKYLELFCDLKFKKIIIHCRNGILNLNTKENRSIPPLNYDLFFQCKKDFPTLNLIPNGEIDTISKIDNLKHNKVDHIMIGRKLSKMPLFLNEISSFKYDSEFIINKLIHVLNTLSTKEFLKVGLIDKSLITYLKGFKNNKLLKKNIIQTKNILDKISILNEYRSQLSSQTI